MNISNQALTAAHSVLGRLQQSVINPIVRLAWDLGLPIPCDALLETTRPAYRTAAAHARV